MLQTIRNHHNVKSIFKQFAEIAEIVYFGDIRTDDDARIYKGVTYAPNCSDTNYCHGTVNDYDLTTFVRKSTHMLPRGDSIATESTIIAIHLKMGGFPHIVLDSRKHDGKFYQSLFNRFPRLRRAGSLLSQMNQSAAHYFDMYINPENNIKLNTLIDDAVLQRLITSFTKYNVEIDDNMLYVFKPGSPATLRELKDMFAEALWLAETIENRAHYASPAYVNS